MTALTPEQRGMYAPPGSMTRRAIDDGLFPWPTLEEIELEDALGDLISEGRTVLADGTVIEVGAPRDAEHRP